MKLTELKEEKYYDRGVFIDQDPFVLIRLWRGGAKVKDFAMLKPKGVRRHDGSIEVQFPHHPKSAKEAAERWASVVKDVEINP
jgi:hypothetical protein